VYFLNRLIPHAEINFIAPFLSNSEVSNEKITVFNTMSASMTSPFFLEMREKSGYSYSAYHYLMRTEFNKDPVIWNATFACQADKVSECIRTANHSLFDIKSVEENFLLAKEASIKQLQVVKKDEIDITDDFLANHRLGFDEDPEKIAYEKLLNLQLAEYLDFIKKMIQISKFNVTVIGDKNRIRPSDLSNLGQFKELKPEQIIGH
ncbi:MAG: hypothetical protein SH817_14325, partial [Leptospira sp.]|nr:hypothetical protein [Leptospira sp.]